jgi:hypothetical protein
VALCNLFHNNNRENFLILQSQHPNLYPKCLTVLTVTDPHLKYFKLFLKTFNHFPSFASFLIFLSSSSFPHWTPNPTWIGCSFSPLHLMFSPLQPHLSSSTPFPSTRSPSNKSWMAPCGGKRLVVQADEREPAVLPQASMQRDSVCHAWLQRDEEATERNDYEKDRVSLE